MAITQYPSYLKLFGGEQVMRGAELVCKLLFEVPDGGYRRYAIEVPRDTFEKVMGLLGAGEEDAQLCGKCGAIKNVRPVTDSHGHPGGFAIVCKCV